MGLFGKKDPQRFFDQQTFTVTSVLFEAPRIALLPTVYQDAGRRLWAVREPNAQPVIFSFDDVVSCSIHEPQPDATIEELQGFDRLKKLVVNPTDVSRHQAAKRNISTAITVVVTVRLPSGEHAQLGLPISSREMNRSSALYQQTIALANRIKSSFDAMKTPPVAQK